MTTAAARKPQQDTARIAALAALAGSRSMYLGAFGHRSGPVQTKDLARIVAV